MKRKSRPSDEIVANLAIAVRRYVNERENPAPDFTMRKIEYDRMVEALAAYDEERDTA